MSYDDNFKGYIGGFMGYNDSFKGYIGDFISCLYIRNNTKIISCSKSQAQVI